MSSHDSSAPRPKGCTCRGLVLGYWIASRSCPLHGKAK